jgi:hypothetical protein
VGAARSPALLVLDPRLVEADPPVGSAPDNRAVMIVLAVVLPSAHTADLVGAPLGKSRVTAARARVWPGASRGEHVLESGVRLEPGGSAREQLLIRDARVIAGPADNAAIGRVAIHSDQYARPARAAARAGVPLIASGE